MGLWGFLTGAPSTVYSGAPSLGSPYAGDSLEAAIVGDYFGALPAESITESVAHRVPELKKALTAHQALVTPLRFEKYTADEKAPAQPFWVGQCAYPGMSRLIAIKQLVSELFWHGFAVLGCHLDTEGNVYDWIVVPQRLYSMDRNTSIVTIAPEVPAEYRMRVVLVPLGANGVMVDGIDTIRESRKLGLARQNRLDSPPAAVELHITDSTKDEMTKREKQNLADSYVEGRNKSSVSVTPSYIDVIERGVNGTLDLFESAKNSLRLELAMHAGVPASFVEGGKEGGTGGQMTYSNENGVPSEMWLYGASAYAYAISAALSQDDVVGPDAEVRFDLKALSIPAPGVQDPEAGDTTPPEQS